METDVVIVQKSPSFREQKVSAELRSLKLFIQIYLQKSLTLILTEKKAFVKEYIPQKLDAMFN